MTVLNAGEFPTPDPRPYVGQGALCPEWTHNLKWPVEWVRRFDQWTLTLPRNAHYLPGP